MDEYVKDARIRTNLSSFEINFNDILLKEGESLVVALRRESEDIWSISGHRDVPWYRWLIRKVKEIIYFNF